MIGGGSKFAKVVGSFLCMNFMYKNIMNYIKQLSAVLGVSAVDGGVFSLLRWGEVDCSACEEGQRAINYNCSQ